MGDKVEPRREFIETHAFDGQMFVAKGGVVVFDIKVVISDTKVVPI